MDDGEAACGDAALRWYRRTSEDLADDVVAALSAAAARPRATYVNLDASTDRRAAMRRLALVHGLALTRFRAREPGDVDRGDVADAWGENPSHVNNFFDDTSDVRPGTPLSATERACAASHVDLWRACRDGGRESPFFTIIVEDDVVFAPRIAAKLPALLDDAPLDCDCVLLGYFLREEADLKDVPAATLKHFVVPSYFWGAHAYALTPAGAAKLLRRLPVDCPLDVFLAMATHSGDLATYAAKHKLAKQRTADTSTVTHTGRANSGVVHDPKKLISFDLCPSAADRVC